MSTILYKFKSSTGFEPISLPGSSARLFDVKRAIVKVNKLDRSTGGGMQLEFDISVKNAMTEEVYDDENMLLPRGTRIVVQRLPAAKGQGLLARIARADAGMASNVTMSYGNKAAASNGFYTIESAREDDEEFVDTNAAVPAAAEPVKDELAALKAVTDQAGDMYRSSTTFTRSAAPNKFGQPGPTSSTGNSFRPPTHQSYQARPNADPELREKERLAAMQTQPKKTRHAPGIPRTFLNIGSSTQTSAEGDEDGAAGIKLQPNQIGFQALINRGGGQAVSGPSRKNDLDYALKLTATEIPVEYQCGVCKEVVKNSVIVPWDTEFRPACEMCMRDGLAKSGFVCPLTGLDGQSPDDLIPNNPHRRTVDTFVKGVMDKMDEIIQQQEADEEQERENEAAEALKNKKANEFEGDGLEKGMILRKGIKQAKSRRQSDEFGEDEFGGDVFDVEADDEEEDVEETQDIHTESLELSKKDENTHIASNQTAKEASVDDKSNKPIADIAKDGETSKVDNSSDRETTNVETKSNDKNSPNNEKSMSESGNENHQAPSTPSKNGDDDASSVASRRELLKNRAPPAGYQMGPAGSAGQQQNSHGYGGRGGRFQNNYNRGRSNNFHGGRGRFQRYSNQHHSGMGYDSGQGGRGYQAQDGYSNGHDFNDQNFGGPDRPNKRTHSEIGGGQGRHSHNGGRFQGRHQGRWNGDGGRGRGRGNFGRGFSDGRFGRGGRGEFRGGFNRGGRGRGGWDHRGRGRYGGRGRF